MARFRARTWIRERAPAFIARHVPRGADCGAHEWYLSKPGHWACYHCMQETAAPPMESSVWARRRLQAINADLAALYASPEIPGDEIVAEIERYNDEVEELRDVLIAESSGAQERLPVPASGQPVPSA